MADRAVLEQRVAQRQVLTATAAQLRQLKSRANRGALRTAGQELFTPNDLTQYTTALSVDVLPGRWMATGEATFAVVAPAGQVALRLTMEALDPSTGLVLTGDNYDFPERKYGLTTASTIRVPITVTGFFVHVVGVDELTAGEDDGDGDSPSGVITINLRSYDALGNDYTLEEPRLLLAPW